jgi:hypothetical protein
MQTSEGAQSIPIETSQSPYLFVTIDCNDKKQRRVSAVNDLEATIFQK